MSEKGLLYLQDNVSDKEVKIQGNTYKENSLGFTCNNWFVLILCHLHVTDQDILMRKLHTITVSFTDKCTTQIF